MYSAVCCPDGCQALFTPLYLPDSSLMLRRRTVKWQTFISHTKIHLTLLMEGVWLKLLNKPMIKHRCLCLSSKHHSLLVSHFVTLQTLSKYALAKTVIKGDCCFSPLWKKSLLVSAFISLYLKCISPYTDYYYGRLVIDLIMLCFCCEP